MTSEEALAGAEADARLGGETAAGTVRHLWKVIAARDEEIARQIAVKVALSEDLIKTGDRVEKLEAALREIGACNNWSRVLEIASDVLAGGVR